MKDQSFTSLFRNSQLAKWTANKSQPIKPSPFPLPVPKNDPNYDVHSRPAFYGLKHDPPARLWGRPVNVIKVDALDGPYGGLGLVNHCNMDPLKAKLFEVLKGNPNPQPGQRVPVVGRVLQRIDNGYVINVAGVQCFLPAIEVPAHCRFTMDDFVRKRAYRFFVKEAQFDAGDKPRIVLSLYQ